MAAATTAPTIDSKILLEAGTNEVEVLVFKVADRYCGVNVAKVREVRTHEAATHLPQSQEAMDGVVRLRDAVIPLVDLERVLWNTSTGSTAESEQHLILEFNDQTIAFRVQGVDRIYRVSWKKFIPLPRCPGLDAPVTGIILLDKRIVTILDFEAIGLAFGMNGVPPEAAEIDTDCPTALQHPPIVFADDSPLIRKMLDNALSQAGYHQRCEFSDGQDAWQYLEQLTHDHTAETIRTVCAGVVSDIEMPRMDGFTLTRKIRENAVLKDLPVVLFSSLISKDNEKKGIQVGATAQVSKPRWEDLSTTLMDAIGKIVR
ncbi:MAG: chemotaxis protein [Patescibacteria group bacterium]|nr:chemotaxis protein [Patescibacteria group bacterium]